MKKEDTDGIADAMQAVPAARVSGGVIECGEICDVCVYAADGTGLIASRGSAVAVDHLAPGLYIAAITTADGRVIRLKFVK